MPFVKRGKNRSSVFMEHWATLTITKMQDGSQLWCGVLSVQCLVINFLLVVKITFYCQREKSKGSDLKK